MINLVVDLLYSLLDPRVRLERAEGMSIDRRLAAGDRRCRRGRDAVPARRLARVRREPHRGRGARRGRRADRAARDARALDRAAEPLRPRRSSTHGQHAAARRARRRRPATYLARHRRPGPRHAVGDPLRPAHSACSSASPRPRSRSRSAPRSASSRPISAAASTALLMRLVDIQLSFPAILIALILLAVLGKGVDKVIIALVVGAMGLLRAHRARLGAGRDAQGIHRGGALPGAAARRASSSATCCRTACRR